ncbi:MAG TPA: hypothetical protein DDW79_06305 [Anaerolineae bacterium]|nr:hypothetical protein [Anaerolineae bacterium]
MLGESFNDSVVRKVHLSIRKHPKIQANEYILNDWSGSVLKRHNDAIHVLHKLEFLAEQES